MNRASSATGWVRNPVMKSPELDPTQASSYELGWTFNPITGCLNHTNGLCNGGGFPCYAYKLANGRLKQRYLANDMVARKLVSPLVDPAKSLSSAMELQKALANPFFPRFWQSRLNEPLYGNPKGIFVCDMGELFGDWLPDGWTNEVFHTINRSPQHRFYLLTKQPQNLIKFQFPDNCWVGVTATNREQYINALKYLIQIRAMVKYISFEPLLEHMVENQFTTEHVAGYLEDSLIWQMSGIGWVIIGAQTKPAVFPKIEWVEEIVRAADKAGVKVFLKDNLWALIPPVNGILGKYKQNDKGINFYLRQEIPG